MSSASRYLYDEVSAVAENFPRGGKRVTKISRKGLPSTVNLIAIGRKGTEIGRLFWSDARTGVRENTWRLCEMSRTN